MCMGLPNRCYGCEYFEGLRGGGTNILCNASGRNEVRNGVVGCNSFAPDSSAGCHNCHYALNGPPGPMCEKNLTSISTGGHKDGFCHGFAKKDYWSNDEANEKKSGCFISTAACSFLGKSDDCYELTYLRSFRDNVLLKQSDLSFLVSDYYDIAPDILLSIENSGIKDEIFKGVYFKFIRELTLNGANLTTKNKIEIYIDLINWIYEKLNNSSGMKSIT